MQNYRGNRQQNHYTMSTRHQVSNCYQLGIITEKQHDMLMAALAMEEKKLEKQPVVKVSLDTGPTRQPGGQFFKFSITIEQTRE